VCSLTVNQVTADSLNPGLDNYVSTVAVQPDGKVLLGGFFLNLAGVAHSALGRLNADGTVDANFTANATAQYFPQQFRKAVGIGVFLGNWKKPQR
jgi:hypothetical protein